MGLLILAACCIAAGLAAPAIAAQFDISLAWPFGALLAAPALLGLLGWRTCARSPRPPRARLALVVGVVFALEGVVVTAFLPALDPEKSPRPIAAAAAELTEPTERIGLVGKPTLVGGLAYYAHRRIDVLDGAGEIERFLAAGGRVIVVPEKRLARVADVLPVEIRARARSGRRALLVVTPAS